MILVEPGEFIVNLKPQQAEFITPLQVEFWGKNLVPRFKANWDNSGFV